MRQTTSVETRAQQKTQQSQSTKSARKSRTTKTSSHINSGPLPPTAISSKEPALFGRVTILDVRPSAQEGVFPARVEIGEPFRVQAQLFGESSIQVGATAVIKNPRGRIMARVPMTPIDDKSDVWGAVVQAGEASNLNPWDTDFAAITKQLGNWKLAVEGWADSYNTWILETARRLEENIGVENAFALGSTLFTRWASTRDAGLDASQRKMMRETAKKLLDTSMSTEDRFALAESDEIAALHITNPLRDGLTASQDHVFHVERTKSSFNAWYQLPLHSSQELTHAPTRMQAATERLHHIQAEGFTIVCLPDVLETQPHDTQVPSGVRNHTTVDPTLGTFEDFQAFCTRAHDLGIEVAVTIPLRFAADHPWLNEHTNWFTSQADGTLIPARDIHNSLTNYYELNIDNDRVGIEQAIEQVLEGWVSAGATLFQIDTPNTQPVRFWQDVIANVTKKHPEVLFLANASQRPATQQALSYAGFTQTHSDFPRYNGKDELDTFLSRTNGDNAFFQHDTLWPSTSAEISAFLRNNGRAGYAVRAVLAAMGSPSWGIDSSYEYAHETNPDELTDGLAALITSLNRIRNQHPTTRSYHTLSVLPSANPAIFACIRHTPAEYTGTGKPDTLIVVVNLDCYHEQQSSIHVEVPQFGLPTEDTYRVRDLLTDRVFDWSWDNYVALAPWQDVAHILSVEY